MLYQYWQNNKHDLLGRSLSVGCLICLLRWCTLSSTVHTPKESEPKCGIYLAPSTIPMAGLGVYAGDVYYMEDDLVESGELAIPIVDYYWNNKGGPHEDDFFLWYEYDWDISNFPGMVDESHGPETVSGISPGVGAAPNCYATMKNIMGEVTLMGRAVDANSPGIGASTLYYGREFFATTDIPPGHELFLDYGLGYFLARTSKYGHLPDPNSFLSTDLLLQKYTRIKKKAISRWHFRGRTTSQPSNKEQQTENEDQEGFWNDLYDILKGMRTIWLTSSILNGLPEEVEQIEHIMANGGSSQQHADRSIRELSWLEQHGQCMDNIKGGDSSIPDAGRGAFASRFIPKGGLVAPAPLIHVQDYNALKMFQPKYDPDHPNELRPDRDGPFTFQLLLNYCFGHEKSTLLLCPYGRATWFINHSQKNPNVRIQWSKRMRHPEWREQPIYRWGDTIHPGLQFDFVALRDIEQDEEILVDYGSAWESAWQEHVKQFVPREGYIPAFELNEMQGLEFRGEDEVDYEAQGLFLMCHGWYIRQYTNQDQDSQCRILKKLENDRYMVQVLKVNLFGKKDGRMTIEDGAVLWSVPSEAMFFKDMPRGRDHYQPNVFRHAMMIPDEMFPEVWKNKP